MNPTTVNHPSLREETMNHRLAQLGNPEADRVPVPARDWIAADLVIVAHQLHEEANTLAAANTPSLQTSIVILRDAAQAVARRADAYRTRRYR